MKKILFALAIMPLLIVACSSDDDKSSTTDFDHNIEFLYGEWRFTSVEVDGVPIDLTEPKAELFVAPTYLKFSKDGTIVTEGALGEGNGIFSTKGKTIYTSVKKHKINFEMSLLEDKMAKIELDAKHLSQLPVIDKDMGKLTVTLKKNYKSTKTFSYNIDMLYGKWRVTSMEGVYDNPINLTDPVIEKIYAPTYLTFGEKGAYIAKGFLGEGSGRYVTEEKFIYTLVGDKNIILEMTALEKGIAGVELRTIDINIDDSDLKKVELVTVVLTKEPA